MATHCFISPFHKVKFCDVLSQALIKVGCTVGKKSCRTLEECDVSEVKRQSTPTAQCYITEGSHLHTHCRKSLKSHIIQIYFSNIRFHCYTHQKTTFLQIKMIILSVSNPNWVQAREHANQEF
jgi:hypothetical protein